MKQKEKTKKTYNRILNAAIEEFSRNSYNNSSINSICSKNNISKGLIYHNFINKDELYLCVLKDCFTSLVNYLKNGNYSSDKKGDNMKTLLNLREKFFNENIYYRNIFLRAIIDPPEHLKDEIKAIKKEYDEFNISEFKKLLKKLKLRDNIKEKLAINYFISYQSIFNEYFKDRMNEESLDEISKEHDAKMLLLLDIMLYGIAVKE